MRYLTTERAHKIAKLADASVAAQDRLRGGNDIRSPEASAAFTERVRSGPSQEEQIFLEAVSGLSDDELAELFALMLLGRGEWDGSFEQAFDHARQLGNRADLERAVTDKSLALSRYVHRGLELLSTSRGA